MALIKEKNTVYGIKASYWKLGSFCIDTVRKEASFIFHLYAEKGAKQYLESICIDDLVINEDKTLYNKYFEDRGQTYKDLQTACYMYVKEHIEFFKDAVDDPEEG